MDARSGATISFHQEQLAGPTEREEMRARWREVVGALERRLVS